MLKNSTFPVDWIEGFLDFTSPLPAPEIFRLWTAISTVSAAMERRLYTRLAGSAVFPNMYILLVGSPGSGKTQAITPAQNLLRGVDRPGFGKLHVAPNSVTKAALLDVIASAKRVLMVKAKPIEYHSLTVAASEFGVLVPSHDNEFLNVLNDLFDCPEDFEEKRRTSVSVQIKRPSLNLLAGVQPGYLANLLPEEAWSMGFMSRVTMIYSSTAPKLNLFSTPHLNFTLQTQLSTELAEITKLCDLMTWEENAQTELIRWYESGLAPVPEHSKLQHYIVRRLLLCVKLCMIAAISDDRATVIRLEHLVRARDWLLHAEQYMPDVFREMTQRSDTVVINEMHYFLWKLWSKSKKPIHEKMLFHFLQQRVPSEKIIRVIEIAARSNIIKLADDSGRMWLPIPRSEHGLE